MASMASRVRCIVKAASSPHKLVFETGCNILVQLRGDAGGLPASSRSWTVRFHAVAYLEAALPESLRLSVIVLLLIAAHT